ncbi:HAD-IA family hydrolase [Nocardia cyriacigeorgica]|uniref:HAD-IA family hydrolase n=1 Tax=Nocardia TaxID=1817 RepID=UPI0018961CAD|nr:MULTISPECIES: HAD-IA family hydrolase [Nocardia]MBF6102292.1 HAD-IA family hydrolase [Nocardia cyriacigeorgica]
MLLDWDGVLHHWNGAGERAGEQAEGLPAGAIAATAFGTQDYEYAKLGILTDAQWRASVATILAERFGGRGATAVAVWAAERGRVIGGAADLLALLRRHYKVGLLSDNTDILPGDLALFGLAGSFDHVFVSAHLGMTKPAPALYRHAARAMHIAPQRVLVIDDLAVNLPGAAAVGMHVHHLAASLPQFVHEYLVQEETCPKSCG